MLHNLSFKRKITLLLAGTLVGLALITGVSIVQSYDDITEGRRLALRTAVESAGTVVAGYAAAAKSGAMSEADAKTAASEALRHSRFGLEKSRPDYFYIMTTDGGAIMHPFSKEWAPGKSALGTKDARGVDTAKLLLDAVTASKTGSAMVEAVALKPGETDPTKLYPKLQYVMTVPEWQWIVGSGLYIDDVQSQVQAAALRQLGLCVVVLLSVGGLGLLISRSVLRQLGGDPQLALDALGKIAQGNLAVDVPAAPAGSLVDGLRRMVLSLRTTVAQVRASTDSVNTAAIEIAAGNADLSVRTEETSANLQKAASSLEQLTVTVQQSAASARQANQLAAAAAGTASRGGAAVSQVVATMDEIHESSRKISEIIGVIDGIASQTNILALNAAVEAARAGEQGRGFAVVASEVRSLAQRSAEAAKEIKGLIGASVDKVEAGSKLVSEAGSTMSDIVASVQRVSDIIGEISAATSEQSEGLGSVNQAVAQLDQMTQQNAALVEQSSAAADSLKEQASRLSHAVGAFQTGSAQTGPAEAPPALRAASMATVPRPR